MRPFVALLLLAAPAAAQTSFPMVTHCTPTAVQRGTTAGVEVAGQMDFRGVYKVLVEGVGVTAEVVKPKEEPKAAVRSVRLKVTAAGGAALGVREFRVASDRGVSSLGQLLIVADPVVVEAPGINTPAKAQPVPVPGVVCGRIEAAENADYYRFAATAGRPVTFEVACARLQDKIHDLQKHADPLIRVFDADGRELAAGDDDYFADPLLTFTPPRDGEYVIEIRDAKYDGDPRWAYAMTITDKPYASHVFPLAVNPGKTVAVEPTGSAKLVASTFPLTAPTRLGVQTVEGVAANPVAVVVTPLSLVAEVEPNDTPKQATRFAVPGGVNGRIQARRDLDHFVFAAAKGQPVRLEVFARRFGTVLRSRLDAVMDVMTPAGAVLASNDDARGKDPMLTFTPTADGDYVVRVRDLNNKGGDGFAYYLEADFARPDFAVKADPSIAMIGPGSRTAWYVHVTRTNGFAGPVKIEVKNLPAGVTASPLTIPANMTQGCVVLSAAKDAKLDAVAVTVVGTAEIDGAPVARAATPVEEIYLPGGGRGRFDVGMQAVAVTGPSDLLDVKVSTNRVVLKPGQEVAVNVTVTRRADYDKPVTLDMLLQHLGGVHGNPLPPGVTVVEGKSKTQLGTGSAGAIVLKAAADAPACADVPVCVQGYVSVNFVVKVGYASAPILVSVTK